MKNQDDIFFMKEADAWYVRNREALAPEVRDIRADLVEKLIRRHRMHPKRVLDVGAANGWRLEAMRRIRPRARYTGVEPSARAVAEGSKRFGGITLTRGVAASLPFADASFDLVLAVFTFHWMARDTLLQSVAEMDRVLKNGGHLIICDFLPDARRKNAYRYRRGVYTWKADYGRLFEESGNYLPVERLYTYTADARGKRSSEFRAAATLYRKRVGLGYH